MIFNSVIQGSGGGSSSFTKLELYTDQNMTNVWVDASRTTTLAEALDYDYNQAKTLMTDTDIVKVWTSARDGCYTVVRWMVDTVDDTFLIMISVSAQPGSSSISSNKIIYPF